jgi:hypothetical protein
VRERLAMVSSPKMMMIMSSSTTAVARHPSEPPRFTHVS